jgi:hypothetical protein
MDAIFASGLHEWIGEFLAESNALAATVMEQYQF